MIETIYSIDEIKNIVTPIALKYGVDRVFLFGSYARGEAKGTSDVDFIIDEGKIRGLQFAGMLGDLQDDLGKNVDLLTSESLSQNDGDNDFKQRVENDMVIIYE
jgi:predicted nucleotidyltransferase